MIISRYEEEWVVVWDKNDPENTKFFLKQMAVISTGDIEHARIFKSQKEASDFVKQMALNKKWIPCKRKNNDN